MEEVREEHTSHGEGSQSFTHRLTIKHLAENVATKHEELTYVNI